ncbi:MAG: YbaK/EbsC family protein [bacterium]|nr:YbaK/EbsC family protein [bacterium]
MKIPAKLTNFLSQNKVKFEEINHRTVYTALDKAATLKVKPKLIAKTLVLKDGKNLFLAVLAANRNLNKEKFKKAAKAKNPDFISERLMKTRFRGYRIGAIPPFGRLFQLPSFVDRGLAKEKLVYASAGTYENSLKISPKVLEKLETVKASFSEAKKPVKKPKKNPPRRRMRR